MVKTKNIFKLISLLKLEPESADRIADKLSISLPTVYRYIKLLRESGYEISYKSKKYFLLKDVSTDETDYKEVVKKQDIIISENYKLKIKNALKFSLPIELKYKKPSLKEDKSYFLYPQDLMMIQNRYYLLATDKKDNVTKEFRLDRIQSINVDHSIKKVISKPFDVVFKISEKMLGYYEEFFDNTEIIKETDKEKIIKAQIHSLFRAKQLLLPYMEHIEILEPEELRGDMISTLKKMLTVYEAKDV